MTGSDGFQSSAVKAVFDSYPLPIRKKLLFLRQLIFKLAAETKGVGDIEETLKWREPSYLTSQTKSGSTIRLAWNVKAADAYGIYFNCQTTLVDTFKERYGDLFQYEGNRAIIFQQQDHVPVDAMSACIKLALSYHLRKAKLGSL